MEGRKKKRREGRGEEWRGKEDGREREDTVHMIVIRAVVKNKGGLGELAASRGGRMSLQC